MNLADLRAAATAALADGAESDQAWRAGAMAAQLAEMVGWSLGPIDPRGDVLAGLLAIRTAARTRFEAQQAPAMAGLHDAIADLMDAIARHDGDLDPPECAAEDVIAIC